MNVDKATLQDIDKCTICIPGCYWYNQNKTEYNNSGHILWYTLPGAPFTDMD